MATYKMIHFLKVIKHFIPDDKVKAEAETLNVIIFGRILKHIYLNMKCAFLRARHIFKNEFKPFPLLSYLDQYNVGRHSVRRPTVEGCAFAVVNMGRRESRNSLI